MVLYIIIIKSVNKIKKRTEETKMNNINENAITDSSRFQLAMSGIFALCLVATVIYLIMAV